MLDLARQNDYRDQLRTLWPYWQPATEVYQEIILRYLEPDTRMLDLGCGRGGVVEQLGGGMGVDPDMLSLSNHRLPVDVFPRTAGVLEQLPFCAASFDLLISSWVFEHLAAPLRALGEMARVLRPGGHLVMLAPNGVHPVTLMNRLLALTGPIQAKLVPQLYGRAEQDAFPVYYRANSVRRLRQMAPAAGLEPVEIHTISDPTYLAFSDMLFSLSRMLESVLPAGTGVHLVADLVRY